VKGIGCTCCTSRLEQAVGGGAVDHIAACVSASPEARTVEALFRPEALHVTDISFLAHSKNELMQWRGVRRLSVCL